MFQTSAWWFIPGLIGVITGGGKLAILTVGAFKVAAVGTAFTLKGIVFTKIGAATIAVTVGGAAYPEVVDATMEAIFEFGYTNDNPANTPIIQQEINIIVQERGAYEVSYCEVDGNQIIIPSNYRFCPHDGSQPLVGESFNFND